MIGLKMKFQLTVIFFAVILGAVRSESKCASYQRLWSENKYSHADELRILASKDFSAMCPKSECCDNNMKNEMVGVSQLKLKSFAQSHLTTITKFLLNNSNTFIDYFHNNLELSKNKLHTMFLSTYSNKYQTNQQFFFEFYDKLKSYMNGKEQNIEKILETFFHDMAEKILVMMDVARKDSETVRCLTNNFLKMNPYQSIDKNIISHFKEAYPTARMMVNSLKAAHDVFLEISNKKMTPSLECSTDYAKAFYCSLCSANEVQPCEGLCRSIMGRCFGSLNSKEMNKLNKAWKNLMMAIEKIAKKLKHPFNYVEVNKNLHVKISDAIMNVQGFFPSVKDKIWENCKTFRMRRRRSDDGNYNQFFENLPKSMDNVQLKAPDFSEILDKFSSQISGMSSHLQKSKNIICSKNFKLPKSGEKCWNGAEITSNYVPKQKDKGQQKSLPIDPIIRKNINQLNNIAQTLNNLLSKKNSDPEAFKIIFIEKPKKNEIPRTRQSRISEPSIEGSGASDTENSNTKPKPEIPPPVENIKPSENIEGSGNKKSPENKDNKNRPAFPEFPTKVSPPKPKKPVTKPITDDEDISNQNENENNKMNKPTDPNKVIEGSGSLENLEKTTEKPTTIITTTTTLEPITEPKKFGKESINTEGSGQSPDDDSPPATPEDSNFRPRYPEIQISSTTDQTTTASILQPNDLPGEIPNEIWIPRIIDDDSRNQVVDNSNSRSWNMKPCVTSISVAVTVSMVSIYRLLSW